MMKSTRETRRIREEDQHAGIQDRKNDLKGEKGVRPRRAAFGDITNNGQVKAANEKKEAAKKGRQVKAAECKIKVPAAKSKGEAQKVQKSRKPASAAVSEVDAERGAAPVTRRQSKESELTSSQESVGSSSSSQESTKSLQDLTTAANTSFCDVVMAELDISNDDLNHSRMSLDKSQHESFALNHDEMPEVPVDLGVEDIDGGDQEDITLVALYAHDIFCYYKEREETFMLTPYMMAQPNISMRMRAVLVDWLVEVQENFELNHETLYLAVKLVDTYLATVPTIQRDILQLLGSAALFLASKFDERLPPAIDDFLYVCDHAYGRSQFLAMERELFRTVGFDLGRPISYRFLRRYARCGRCEIKTLYLARYLLELSLMEYKFVFQRDSMLAASCLYIAKRMRDEGDWTPTLEFYSGYKLNELKPLILLLNPLFTTTRYSDLTTIREKYKHYLFHSVGTIAPLTEDQLFPATEDEP